MTQRLIEDWLPIAALGEESVPERRSMKALPPIYYLHVWWARRPLVASRAAVLGSLLPADADQERFLHMLGIHGDPLKANRLMDQARRTGVRVEDRRLAMATRRRTTSRCWPRWSAQPRRPSARCPWTSRCA